MKEFVSTLKGIAFDWYTDLEPESINSWEQMEQEFLNRFYSTQRIVSMTELTNTMQWKNEPVLDYINRWRSLSLECKDRLSEALAVDICAQGMEWDILYALQVNKPKTFQGLATRAHDMELTIANRSGRINYSKSGISFGNGSSSVFKDFDEKEYSFSDSDTPKEGNIKLDKEDNDESDYGAGNQVIKRTLKSIKMASRGQISKSSSGLSSQSKWHPGGKSSSH